MIQKIMLSLFIIGVTGMLAGAADLSPNALPSGEEQAPAIDTKLHKDMLVLDDIGDDYVMFSNRMYEVTSHTTIKNERGTTIALASLTIPCEAMVSYYRKKGEYHTYVAVAIEVRGEAEPVPE
jgi:hypothetical protein